MSQAANGHSVLRFASESVTRCPFGDARRAYSRVMAIEKILAVVSVRDLDASRAWYSTLFGREPDNNPMPSLVEWNVVGSGWVQVSVDADRAGSSLLNVAVSDLDADRQRLIDRGLEPSEIQNVNKGVQLSALTDPDGNTVTMIGSFREVY